MNIYSEFNFNVDKERAISSIGSYWSLPSPVIIDITFDRLLMELRALTKPLTLFKFQKKPKDYNFSFLENCEHLFFCVLTLGDECRNRVEELFNQGKMFEAILLDAMESLLLFEYMDQFQKNLALGAKKLGMGVTCRICPGDGEIPIEYQEDILGRIGDTREYGIHIDKGYLLCPSKSLSFVYGAGKEIEFETNDAGCVGCYNKYCNMRKK